LLALFAAGLVVVFDAVRALGFQAADVRTGIIDTVDLRIDAGRFRAIDDLPG
jgi:hypothetical protein